MKWATLMLLILSLAVTVLTLATILLGLDAKHLTHDLIMYDDEGQTVRKLHLPSLLRYPMVKEVALVAVVSSLQNLLFLSWQLWKTAVAI